LNKKQIIITTTIAIILLSAISPNTFSESIKLGGKKEYQYSYEKIDVDYIYNITEALSNIIFTEYDEESGEIAKGRAYGTKGEHKAAEILYENMSAMGLHTYKEQIKNTDKYPKLTHELEVVDYFVKINNKTIDSYISPVWKKNTENNHDINHTYNYSNLKVITPPLIPSMYILKQKIKGELEPFVIILKDKSFYPYNPITTLFPFLDNLYFNYYLIRIPTREIQTIYARLWDKYMDYCKGIILYDFNEDCYDMNLLKNSSNMPFICINGTNGKKILNDIENNRVDFKLEQRMNTSIESYNVIGQLNATNPENDTVIVDCLYDSWWCQGTADAAIGMAMVLGIAKYFTEHNITPKYNIKFIGFSGEEHGFCAGSKYYENLHENEKIKYVIDLNQLGFWQDDPKLTLDVIANKLVFLNEIWKIVKQANYGNRVNSSDKAMPVWIKNGGPSNSQPFASNRENCKTVCFLKDSGWKLHHRDGLNHTEGDVLKYFDPEDVNVTGEIILNVVKYLTTDF
jgi:hypothetical protein